MPKYIEIKQHLLKKKKKKSVIKEITRENKN